MKTLIAICLIGLSLLVACGGGPTAPKDVAVTSGGEVTPVPTPPPQPCRPRPTCSD